MELIRQFSLQQHNSFNVQTISQKVYRLESLPDLASLPNLEQNAFYILGEGSNTLFIEHSAPIIIKPDFKGIEFTESDDNYIVTVAAGENWHDLVTLCINKGVNGLENLALIPGSVGAAPVQNIGAYGVEFSDFCSTVKWYDFASLSIKSIKSSDCQFGYRDSVFKQHLYNKGIITEVELIFPKKWQPNISYSGLDTLDGNTSAKQVMETVIALRQAKLPDPKLLPNAGSFFKNPLVDQKKFEHLKSVYTNMPFYLQNNGQVKLAAGWLIEHADLKGYCNNGVCVHEHQALVLVNHSSKEGRDVVALAQIVQHMVFEKFKIILMPEVRMVTSQGEVNFADLPMIGRW